MDPLIARARAPKVLFGLLSELEFQIQRSLARSRVTFTCLPRHDLFQRAAFEATRKHLEINVLSISLFLSLSLSLSLSLWPRGQILPEIRRWREAFPFPRSVVK